jgi:hypothetical protein
MTIKRSFVELAVTLVVALIASTAHAEQVKTQTEPAGRGVIKVDSPNMATSVRDWHPELNAAATPSAPTTPTISCTCGKTITQTATNTTPTGQSGNRGNRSGKPTERAQEVPLSSIRP